ncbi:MAG: hypothetical protein ACFFD2_06175 [Promethearchaeota archaeon]
MIHRSYNWFSCWFHVHMSYKFSLITAYMVVNSYNCPSRLSCSKIHDLGFLFPFEFKYYFSKEYSTRCLYRRARTSGPSLSKFMDRVFTKTISEVDDYMFASITENFNPMYVEEEYAKRTKNGMLPNFIYIFLSNNEIEKFKIKV